MVLVTKNGEYFNPYLKWAVEAAFYYDDDENPSYWTTWKKYKTQKDMLQGLRDLKKNEDHYYVTFNGNKKKVHWVYRPVHVYYDHLFKRLNTESNRKWKISKLLKTK